MQEFVLKFHYKDENHLHCFDGRTEWLVEPKWFNERERGQIEKDENVRNTWKACETCENVKMWDF